jgi:PIN domain nuclease of toxin-antitoxin system
MIFLDTNVTIWCFLGRTDLLSEKAIYLIEENDLYVSPMVRLELQYLYEIKRAEVPADKVLNTLYKSIGLCVHDFSFAKIIDQSIPANWTRDPFDRIIMSEAKALDAPLLTKDENILKFYEKAIWYS